MFWEQSRLPLTKPDRSYNNQPAPHRTKSYQINIETNDTSKPKCIEAMTRDVIIISTPFILFRSIFLLEIDFDTYRERFPAIHWPNIGLDELTHAPNTGKQYDRNSAAAAAAKHEISLPYREISTEQNPESSFQSFSASLTKG
jgi:hypothetical protein